MLSHRKKNCFVINSVPHCPRPLLSCISQTVLSQGGFSSSGSFLGVGNAGKATISAHARTQEG